MSFAAPVPSSVRVGIAGGTGYAGQELVRLLARHPGVSLTAAMSSGGETRRLPSLARIWDGDVQPLDLDSLARTSEVVFLGLPEAAAAGAGAALIERGLRVIDLSGAFRLRDDGLRKRWYPDTGMLPDGTLYALPERSRAALPAARLVSCPGCYPTAALLALQPLADAGLLAGDVIIDAKSGVSGAGKGATDRTHFSENHGSAAAYGIFSHRHTAEMEQALDCAITFVPHLVPLNRGILETIYTRVTPGTAAAAVGAALRAAYADSPFVRLWDDGLPEIKHVAYTPFCDIGWRIDEATSRLVIVVCLDNLLKGAASQAVQNFNLMCGLDERAGLL
ncbi:MAG: N-acetyl-gamma-glutamyl-phosphate reductase [Vicinamibacterales bacterium]|jgi:N-acetyl-gamma-glutamyl-phosphate reductase|nr:N-acetyl-gamma-glutamyl-phosphate reductase [Vicinamibacterales bacterium]